jgi:predicted metal-dependent enzyme (double-stranded beta helix superfamily)
MSGTESLVSLVEQSLQGESAEEIVNRLRTGLCELITTGEMELPPRVLETFGDHYARRLIHQDDAKGYSIVAMTGGPKQGTPLHDHGGMWCVEGVCRGSIEVQQFELVEHHDERFRFEKRGSFQAGIGSAGCLIPPHEYHTIRNAGAKPAVSVHIYGGEMSFCNVFEPANDGWFVRRERSLNLDL